MADNENRRNSEPHTTPNGGEQTARRAGARRRTAAPKPAGETASPETAAVRKPRKPRTPKAAQAGQSAQPTQASQAEAKPRAPRAPRAARAPKAAAQSAQAAPARTRRAASPAAQAGDAPAKAPARQQRPRNADRPQVGRRRIVAPVQQADKPCISQTLQLVGKKPPTMRSRASEHPSRATLRMIPLGGMCEIGKNMTAYEYGSDIIIVDCGQIFPDETMPGVDAVIPDFTYVLQNRDRVRGIFITHGHEDHIGGLPYLLREFKAPVYGGRMAIELLRYKLDDRVPGLTKTCELHDVNAGDVIRAGCFTVEFIHVNHSIADAFMFAIRTPIGTIVHSG
ncbi:MAG: MBL fold metallo-hydrolase, partial [Candidatus Ventricola sp.]